MANTAELAIFIRAKDEASKVLGQVSKESGGLSSSLKTLALAAGAAVASFASFKMLESAISTTEELGSAIRKMMRETGLSAEESSRLIHAFKMVGLTGDDASRSIGIFAKKLKGISDEETGVATGGKSMAGILADMGIQALDASGNIQPINDLLPQLADQFKAMPDGLEKTGLAMQLFGRSGKDMIPLLNQGSAGLEELGAQADKLGLTLSAENVEKIKAYTISHRAMGEALAGVKLQIGMELMPILTKFAAWFTEHQPQIREFIKEGIEKLKEVLGGLVDTFQTVRPILEDSLRAIKDGFETIKPAMQWILDNKIALTAAFIAIGVAGVLAFTPITVPVLAVIAVIGALLLAVGLIKEHWDDIKAKTLEVWDTISDFLDQKFGFLRGLFETAFDAIKRIVEFVWTDIQTIFQFALDTITNAFAFFKAIFTGDWEAAWQAVRDQFGAIWDLIAGLFTNRLKLIGDIATYALAVLKNVFFGGFNAVKDAVAGVMDALRDFLSEHWKTIVQVALAVLFPAAGGLFWIATHFEEVKEKVLAAMGTLATGLGWVWAGITMAADAMWQAIRATFNALMAGIETVINGAIDAINAIPDIDIGPVHLGIPDIGRIELPRLAEGIRGFPGGLAWVGERGPELAYIPRGSDVYSAQESRQIAGAQDASTTIINKQNYGRQIFNFPRADSREAAREIDRQLRGL